MTDKNIHAIVDHFNKKQSEGFIASQGISGNVAFEMWTGPESFHYSANLQVFIKYKNH